MRLVYLVFLKVSLILFVRECVWGNLFFATCVSDVHLLIEDNVNGFLCKANSPSSISHALTLLVSCSVDKLSNMGKINALRSKDLFDKVRVLGDYEEMF